MEETVKDLDDKVCPDKIYRKEPKILVPVESKTLECGVAPPPRKKHRTGDPHFFSDPKLLDFICFSCRIFQTQICFQTNQI